MAIMIPDRPHEFVPASQEGLMFDALAKLPDEYYVFHSFRITSVSNNILNESEIDFVVFNRKRGIICLEAKSGLVNYEDGYWYYENGSLMHNGGPFTQASKNKYDLLHVIERSSLSYILPRCKMLHAVWFPSISEEYLRTMVLPSEGDKKLVLTKEALEVPEKYLERIFTIELPNGIQTVINEYEEKNLIKDIFCPQFKVFPTASFANDLKKIVFHRLLKEQSLILNYLTEQRSAVINGVAGTGKTMIAVEKAQRHAREGDKVLFLCFNAELKKHLEENYFNDNISYYTIPGFACYICSTREPNYSMLNEHLEDMFFKGTFPYQHVIIDEGQDFGQEEIEETNTLQLIKEIIDLSQSKNGSFYVFYDKLQLVQAKRMPKFIEESDCKLTLYRNCRNTENIAETSLRPISGQRPKLLEGCVKGVPPKIHYCNSDSAVLSCIDSTIARLKMDKIEDIVILTVKTESTSILAKQVNNGFYNRKYKFTTCRKFKGLEADAIILVDIDRETFNANNVLLFYVGSSRARLQLEIISRLTSDDCEAILKTTFKKTRVRNSMNELANALNAKGYNEEQS